ncbi:MAG: phage head closure protein [Planococcaceae bacterium]|nr:phage head closure protein [Planococcaceae bacterium]
MILLQPFKYNPNYHTGKFNKRVTFQEFGDGKDADGFLIEEWVDVKSAWAMIKTIKGSEYSSAASTQNENVSRFVIHFTTGLHPDMRVMFKERIFSIESIINDDEANRTLTIMVKEAIV